MNPLARAACFFAVCALAATIVPDHAQAQVSFSFALSQAIQDSPKVQAAQDDLRKAQAGLAVMKDIYIPSVVIGGGLGTASGITLSVPTIFTVSSQSLVYSPQQRWYIRSARLDLKAANYALADARDQVAQDAAETYLTICHDQAAEEAISQQSEYRLELVSIIEDRVNAHLDNELDLKKARRDALQARLQVMQIQDFLNMQHAHLSELTGIPAAKLVGLPSSVPDLPEMPEEPGNAIAEGPGLLAAETNQQSREIHAHGDAQYTWKPIINFGAQYGRVSPIENVSEFYNLHGNYNTASIGVQIQFPLFDRVRSAAAKASAADAAHGAIDLQTQKLEQAGEQARLQRSAAELSVKAQLADLDYGIAQDELQSVLIAAKGSTGPAPVTPKEEQNARIQERQAYLEMLDARLSASRAEIDYLRQAGKLEDWLQSLNPDVPMFR
jgi:outer membrane protein TolC